MLLPAKRIGKLVGWLKQGYHFNLLKTFLNFENNNLKDV